jgi:hypothetical protein
VTRRVSEAGEVDNIFCSFKSSTAYSSGKSVTAFFNSESWWQVGILTLKPSLTRCQYRFRNPLKIKINNFKKIMYSFTNLGPGKTLFYLQDTKYFLNHHRYPEYI